MKLSYVALPFLVMYKLFFFFLEYVLTYFE